MERLIVQETGIPGCLLIEPVLHTDQRGYFMELFNKVQLEKYLGHEVSFVQDNVSQSGRNVLRGLHYQAHPYSQAKLVGVMRGRVLDVVVDLRRDSPAYGQHLSVELSGSNHRGLFIPRGLAHGFLSLEAGSIFYYKCDAYYNPDAEAGLLFNDPDLRIDWGVPEADIILSDKDRQWPFFKDLFR